MRGIIDVHVHIGKSFAGEYTAEDAIKKMDGNGIDYAVISPVPAFPLPYGVRSSAEQNDIVAAALKKYPGRFLAGLGTVDPRHGDAALPEVKRIFDELNLQGLMFNNDKTGVTMDNPAMIKFLKAVPRDRNAVILMHTSHFSVLEPLFMLGKLAAMFPDLTFINAASMRDTVQSNSSRDLSSRFDNVYMDTACTHYILNPIENAVREAGEDKLVFGTDYPYYEIAYDKMIVDAADISDSTRAKIYYENARRIFHLS